MRGEVKDHGTGRLIEGPLEPGSAVAVLDDVCSTGGSLFRAIAAAEGRGCRVVKVLTILDRSQGGGEEMRARGYDISPLLVTGADGSVSVA